MGQRTLTEMRERLRDVSPPYKQEDVGQHLVTVAGAQAPADRNNHFFGYGLWLWQGVKTHALCAKEQGKVFQQNIAVMQDSLQAEVAHLPQVRGLGVGQYRHCTIRYVSRY